MPINKLRRKWKKSQFKVNMCVHAKQISRDLDLTSLTKKMSITSLKQRFAIQNQKLLSHSGENF